MVRIAQPDITAPASDWLVFGDALQEVSDPRGELVGLSHGIDEGRTDLATREAYVARYADALLGPAAAHADAYALTFRFCQIVGASIRVVPGDDAAAIVGALLAAPLAANLASLELVAHAEKGQPLDLGPAVALIAEHGARVKTLALVDGRAAQARMLVSNDYTAPDNLVAFGSLAPLWETLEHLRLVVADSEQLVFGAIVAPELRSFELACLRYGDGYAPGPNALSPVFAAAVWPKLTRFAIRLAETWMANVPDEIEPYVPVYSDPTKDYDLGEAEEGELDGVDWAELDGMLANLRDRPLTHLALTSFANANSLLETLARVGLPPTLRELDLSDSRLLDGHVDVLLAQQAQLGGLARLVLQHTPITEVAATRLAALGPEIVHSVGDGARYRYLVGAE